MKIARLFYVENHVIAYFEKGYVLKNFIKDIIFILSLMPRRARPFLCGEKKGRKDSP